MQYFLGFFKPHYKTGHGLFGHIFYFTARATPGVARTHGKRFKCLGIFFIFYVACGICCKSFCPALNLPHVYQHNPHYL
jgi:hypothetical protein